MWNNKVISVSDIVVSVSLEIFPLSVPPVEKRVCNGKIPNSPVRTQMSLVGKCGSGFVTQKREKKMKTVNEIKFKTNQRVQSNVTLYFKVFKKERMLLMTTITQTKT